jgi:hypothetical protein
MVWNQYGNAPTHKHDSRESADREAGRLAALHPGREFVVLKAVGGHFSENPQVLPIKIVRGEDDPDISW